MSDDSPAPSDAATPQTPAAASRRSLFRQWRRHRLVRPWRQNIAFWLGALLVGLVALAFAHLADLASATFRGVVAHSQWWPWLLCPAGFAALAWLTQGALKNTRGSGIPQVIVALGVRSSRTRNALLSLRIAVGKLVLTLAALLVGASAGREGPTVHIGAALMYSFGRRLGLYDKRTVSGLILAGGAAGIAAAFNTPLGGVVFAIEELSKTFEQRFSGLVLTAVLLGGVVTLGLMGGYSYFGKLSESMPFGPAWAAVVACGVLGGLLGGIYCRLILPTRSGPLSFITRWRGRWPVRFAAACGLLLALLGLCSGQHIFGTGYAETRSILEGTPVVGQDFLLWKFLANVVSFVAGIPGGLFSPSLTVGASLAPWLAPLIPGAALPAVGLLGMSAYLAGVTRTPLTASVITIELSHSPDMLLPILAATLLASAISRRISPVPIYHALARQMLETLPSAKRPAEQA
ncbi:chloride channel protein [Pseudomonas citronellolis]|uniref:chloride channel protein n=1 Tax=Pseudomonas citronellolis TaxID=53408 RepID=UPI0023E42D8A|nr:chloride channel protein [Pseudomonas citronellolis]MDF3932282.1 chloride channel protein [Pseudomonas citronellolis]